MHPPSTSPAYYLPHGNGRYEPTGATESPWDRKAQHGGPPVALLAHVIDQTVEGTMRIGRISADFFGPIPLREVAVEVSPIRPGRRVRLPLIEGVPLTGQDRVLIAADSANGLSLSLPMEQWFSIPPTMTATLLRPPTGDWVHLACRTHLTDDGVGLAHADLFDTHGFVGEVAQPLLVQRREAGQS